MIQVFPTNFPPQNTPIVDTKGNMTTPGMAFLRAIFDRTGQGPGLANQVTTGIASDISIPGTPLASDWNLITTAPGLSSNVVLPSLTGGQLIVVENISGVTVTINAPGAATIDGGANYNLASTKMQIFWFFSASQIFSTQLG